jgi:hypothetical protein
VGTDSLILPGLLAAAAGMFILTRLTPQSTDILPQYLAPALVLTGLGLGCVMPPTASLATANMHQRDIGAASAAYNASQQLGAALGTALHLQPGRLITMHEDRAVAGTAVVLEVQRPTATPTA